MGSLQLNASEVAYHLERLSASSAVRNALERMDKESFRSACKSLHVPEKYMDILVKIIFSSVEPNQAPWPWG